jgi:hypothetical protein
VAIIVSEHDSVIDVPYTLNLFDKSFIHPDSRLIYYGKPVPGYSQRITFLADKLPQWRISSFSHMGVLFAPDNELYGFDGSQRMCENGQEEDKYNLCLAGEEIWYSAWGYNEPAKIHARLTFNPYFFLQSEIVLSVFNGNNNQPLKPQL